jgi:predicted helicase
MKRQDMGIDIVVKTDNAYYAVQCKYKKRGNKTANILSWTALSTFYAMCLRTGPWSKYIVMTNCDYTRHQGGKTSKDLSICLKTFQNLQKTDWLKLCTLDGSTLSNLPNEANLLASKPSIELTKEELRTLRLSYYEKNVIA